MNRTKLFLASILSIVALLGLVALVGAQTPVTVEPTSLRTDQGGTVTIYATGTLTFTAQHTVRLVGYGILPTSYVNPTALQATVPTGLAAGDYALNVLDGNGSTVGAGSLKLTAPPTPAPPPQPTSAPPPGRPILTIRNYSVTPPKVRPGQEFTVTVEVYNNGSRAGENTMAVIPGGTFLPVGETGHMYGTVHINHTFVVVQRMRVPANTSSGVQNVTINLSANDWEGTHYDYPQNVAVEVIGGSGGAAASGQPKIIIEEATTDPPLVAPGMPFTLTLRLANRGSRTATNVTAHADTAVALPAEGSGIVSCDIIRIDRVVTVTLPLRLKAGQEGGRQGLNVTIESSDYSGGTHSSQQTVALDVDASLANRSQLLIDGYHTTPELISPGDSFTLTLHLTNVGGGDAQRLTLSLGGEKGENLGAFVPIEGSNVLFVSSVAAGKTADVSLRLLVSGDAGTKAHSLPVALAYDTVGGTREKSVQQVSLMVRRRPAFKVSFYHPVEGAMAGQPFKLSVEVLNAGNAKFNVPELQVSSAQLEFLDETSTYVGDLDSGGSWNLDTMALAAEPGPVDVIVNVSYVDDLNQTQVISQTLSFEVQEGWEPDDLGQPGEMEQAQPETLWHKILRAVKGFLGLGS